MKNKVICDGAAFCKLPCEHKDLHDPIYREPMSIVHPIGCQYNQRQECNGQCIEERSQKMAKVQSNQTAMKLDG
jgi:hypothetical protein